MFAIPTTADTNVTVTADPSYATEPPTVTASDATGVGTDSGTLQGEVTDNGGGDITMRGFEWGTETGNYTSSWNQTGSFTIGTFDHEITDLGFCTEIFWRAFAANSYGQGNSTEESFTTACLPSAPTDFTVTQIGINSANITWTMGYAATSTVIVVGEGTCPANQTDGLEVYAGNGTSVIINGLMFELTTYCYRAWSLNEYGYSIDYAEDTIGNAIGLPNILFVVGLCGYALWRKDWIRVLLALCIIAWGAFAFDYDIKIAVPLVAVGTILFFMGILRIIEQRRQEGT